MLSRVHANCGRLGECTVYYHVKERQFYAMAKDTFLSGCGKGEKRYSRWWLEDSKLVISKVVTFDQNSVLSLSKTMCS